MTAEDYDNLPENVKDIINSFDEDSDSYIECERIISELNLIGYTAEYYLDGVLFNITPL